MYSRIITPFSILICILVNLAACKSKTSVVAVTTTPLLGTAVYAILPYDTTMADMNWRYRNVQPGVLTAAGVDSLEAIIENACKAYNEKKATDTFYQVRPLNIYCRQYVPVVTANGERVVWVNFFCENYYAKWRKEIVSVNDGGNCFFQLFIDVNHREVYDLWTNGYAFLPERSSTLL